MFLQLKQNEMCTQNEKLEIGIKGFLFFPLEFIICCRVFKLELACILLNAPLYPIPTFIYLSDSDIHPFIAALATLQPLNITQRQPHQLIFTLSKGHYTQCLLPN